MVYNSFFNSAFMADCAGDVLFLLAFYVSFRLVVAIFKR